MNIRPAFVTLLGGIDKIVPPELRLAIRRGQLNPTEMERIRDTIKTKIINHIVDLGESRESAEQLYAGKHGDRLQQLIHKNNHVRDAKPKNTGKRVRFNFAEPELESSRKKMTTMQVVPKPILKQTVDDDEQDVSEAILQLSISPDANEIFVQPPDEQGSIVSRTQSGNAAAEEEAIKRYVLDIPRYIRTTRFIW